MNFAVMKVSSHACPGEPGAAVLADDLVCEICGGQMVQRQCKISCPNCGFTRDCSDP